MKAAVTGANGFLGRHLVRALREEGHEVVAGTRRDAPELAQLGARVVKLDLDDRDALRAAFDGVEVVFHVAAKTGVWGAHADFVRSNVRGTENVVAACESRHVRKLVFTSSPSVVFDGHDHVRASNELPYSRRFLCAYPATKAEAERCVLGANGRWGLATCALRPHLIFGADDPHLIPRIVERARAGKLVRVGEGKNEVTICAVENAARAHVLAAKSLSTTAPHAGKAYFVGQTEPIVLWPWIDELLARLGAPRVRRSISRSTAYALGAACELAWRVAGRREEPPMTRFVALQLSSSHSYDMEPARRDFGYTPVLSTEEATARLVKAHAR